MLPIKLKMQGSLGIKAGLGLDEIELDLDKMIPDGAKIIAIKGDNGTGKSTLLNLGLTPWLSPPQISGTIYDHFGDKGLRELEWTHASRLFRTRIEYRNGSRPTQKAFLHEDRGDGWQPVRLDDNTVSDGKARTYTACLTSILGSEPVYYLAAFRAQNAPKIGDYSDQDSKALMRDLLHLDEPQALAEQSATVIRAIKQALSDMEFELKAHQDKMAALEGMRDNLAVVSERLPELQNREDQATQALALAKAEHDAAVSKNLDAEKARLARKEVKDRIRKLAVQKDREKKSLQHAEQVYRDDVQASKKRISAAEKLLERREEILNAEETIAGIEKQIADADKKITQMEGERTKKQSLGTILGDMKWKLKAIVQEGKRIRADGERWKELAGYVSEVPCHGEPPYDQCPALLDAQTARGKIEPTEQLRLKKLEEYKNIERKMDETQRDYDELGDPTDELNKISEKSRSLRDRIAGLQRLAAMRSQLDLADGVVDDEIAALKQLDQRLATKRTHITEALSELSGQMAQEEEALENLPNPSESNLLDHADRLHRQARRALQEAQQSVQDATSKISALRSRIEAMELEIPAGDRITKRSTRLQRELAIWRQLREALIGVVNLSIEAAGPEIAETANQLLNQSYGPRFSIKIVTQRELKSKAGILVECFDISVIDADTGLETLLIQKSGGETVWLEKALREAVGIYHQNVTGESFDAVFSDEAEDGLTNERKQQYYRMDRAAMELGGYALKIFVSHNPDAWQMADAVIDMERLAS